MPAKAGIQKVGASSWIPAFAGMTTQGFRIMNRSNQVTTKNKPHGPPAKTFFSK